MAQVLGTFSKGTIGALSVNYGVSAGINCDISCRHHVNSTAENATFACYAVVVEKRADRAQLAAKLRRHEGTSAAALTAQALSEIQALLAKGKKVPWIRLSTNGSVPQPENADKAFLRVLRVLLTVAKREGIPVHFPVETAQKAEFYRKAVGDLVTIRESLQAEGDHKTAQGAVSFTGGAEIKTGANIRKRRIQAARDLAKERREATGRKTIVCPAVVSSFVHRGNKERNALAKCGNCTACAVATIDVVYPQH